MSILLFYFPINRKFVCGIIHTCLLQFFQCVISINRSVYPIYKSNSWYIRHLSVYVYTQNGYNYNSIAMAPATNVVSICAPDLTSIVSVYNKLCPALTTENSIFGILMSTLSTYHNIYSLSSSFVHNFQKKIPILTPEYGN